MIRDTLKWYVAGFAYLRAFELPNAYRIDLTGRKIETITEEEKAYAKAKLNALKNKAKLIVRTQKKQ